MRSSHLNDFMLKFLISNLKEIINMKINLIIYFLKNFQLEFRLQRSLKLNIELIALI